MMGVATLTQPAPARVWRRRAQPLAKLVISLLLGVLAVEVMADHWSELSGAGVYLTHLNAGWVAVAVLAEATSMLSFTALQKRLLAAGGVDVHLGPLVAITLAGNAIANTLPGGAAFASVFAYRQYRRKGADEALATWTLVAVTGLTAVTLAALAVVGLVVAGNSGLVGTLGPLLGLLVAGPVVGVAVLLRPQLLASIAVGPLRLVQRVFGWPARPIEEMVAGAITRLQAVTPRLPDWLVALAWAGGNWVADSTCLVAAFLAVGAPVPTRALLLAYGAAQTAANLPITPGGLGVVEGSLTVALVAFGGSTSATVAAVLLYRVLSFWVLLPVGWTAWSVLTVAGRRRRRLHADQGEVHA